MKRLILVPFLVLVVFAVSVLGANRGLASATGYLAYWATGLEMPNLKSSFPSDGWFVAQSVADSVPKTMDVVILTQVYMDKYAKEIIYRLREHYPYYFRPKPVSSISSGVQCNSEESQMLWEFENCLQENRFEFGIVSMGICSNLLTQLAKMNNQCLECYFAESIEERQLNTSNYYNLLAGNSQDVQKYKTGNSLQRCSSPTPTSKLLYNGTTGFLVLLKEPFQDINGATIDYNYIGISRTVKKDLLLSDYGNIVTTVDSSMITVKSYLEFSYKDLKILAAYLPFDWGINIGEQTQLDIIKNTFKNDISERYDLIIGTLNSEKNYQPDLYNFLSSYGYSSATILTTPESDKIQPDWGVQFPTSDVSYCWNNLFPRCKDKNYYNRSFLDVDKALFNYNKGKKKSINRKCNYVMSRPTRKAFSVMPYDNSGYYDRFTQKSRHSGFTLVMNFRVYNC